MTYLPPLITEEGLAHAAKTRRLRTVYDNLAVYFVLLAKKTSGPEADFYNGLHQTFCNLEREMFISGNR